MDPQRKKQLLERISQPTLDHYSAILWIQPTLQDPSFTPVAVNHEVTSQGVGHTLMGKTWNTTTTIPHRATLHRLSRASSPLDFPQSEHDRPEARRFYTFGGDLNAHPHFLHGGVVSCILDSSLGGSIEAARLGDRHGANDTMYTVQLNVTFKRPVKTPTTVLVRSWVERIEGGGRKIWVKGVIEGEGSVVHALAEGLWLRSPHVKL